MKNMDRRSFLGAGMVAFPLALMGQSIKTSAPVKVARVSGGEDYQSHPQGLSPKEFGEILPENINWMPFPAFPPSVRLAILVGDPAKSGPYAIRVKLPAGEKIMPHLHPEDRIYTVISGVFYIGQGKTFDPDKLKAYAPGSVIVLPGNTPHFHWAKSGEYVSQVTAYGPLGLSYVDPKDDPRKR